MIPSRILLLSIALVAVAASSAGAQTLISKGQTIKGQLGGSILSTDYQYVGTAGEMLVITLASADFDTYAEWLRDGLALEGNDDAYDAGTDSRIPLRVASDGTYTIRVESWHSNPTGSYTLSVEAMDLAEVAEFEEDLNELFAEYQAKTDLTLAEHEEIGRAFFEEGLFEYASVAYSQVAKARPNSRDAWYNVTNALYGAELWDQAVPAALRLTALDPLSEIPKLILARAQRDMNQSQAALATLESIDAMPIKFETLSLLANGDRLTIRGNVVGGTATPGSVIRLRFTFFDINGAEARTATVPVIAPATGVEAGEMDLISTDLQWCACGGYMYEVLN